MPGPTLPRQRSETPDGDEETAADQSTRSESTASLDASFEVLIERMIESQITDLERELEDLQEQVEEIDNFARISLNERKIKRSEESLTEFSNSLTSFAEKAFNNINALEDRLDIQALLLASILDALRDEGIELDLSEVERYRQPSVVTDSPPDEQLNEALDNS